MSGTDRLDRLGADSQLPAAMSALDPKGFNRVYIAERTRSERHDRRLALLVVGTVDGGRRELDALLGVLATRIAPPDTLGRIDARRVGVLMPETGPAKGRRIASALVAELAKAGLSANCILYVDTSGPAEEEEAFMLPDGVSASGPVGGDPAFPATTNAVPTGEIRSGGSIDEVSEIRRRPETSWVQDTSALDLVRLPRWKRVIDVAASSIGLVLLLPLFALIAIAIKLTSAGPVFFVQKRMGPGHRAFDFYKFRTMYLDAERRRAELEGQNEQSGPIFKIRNDPRITPVGRILRKLSLDELPQLLNVLRGEMTLIGPRPPLVSEVEEYERWQRARLNILGGLTCTWQVNGRSEIGFTDWVRMDIRYSRDHNWKLDLQILVKTIRAVITGRGAY